jgi:hypothetical protein
MKIICGFGLLVGIVVSLAFFGSREANVMDFEEAVRVTSVMALGYTFMVFFDEMSARRVKVLTGCCLFLGFFMLGGGIARYFSIAVFEFDRLADERFATVLLMIGTGILIGSLFAIKLSNRVRDYMK